MFVASAVLVFYIFLYLYVYVRMHITQLKPYKTSMIDGTEIYRGFNCTLPWRFYTIYVWNHEINTSVTLALIPKWNSFPSFMPYQYDWWQVLENTVLSNLVNSLMPAGIWNWKVVGHFVKPFPAFVFSVHLLVCVCFCLCTCGTCSETVLVAGVSLLGG